MQQYLNTQVYFNTQANHLIDLAKNYQSVIVVCDKNSGQFCLPKFRELYASNIEFSTIIFDAGEEHKNLNTANFIWQNLLQNHTNKKSLIIALGGGVVCDITGFAASMFMRGIDFVFFPTTLLAMVDASIGGKNGIDLANIKNMVGTITQPKAIFIDSIFLQTLPIHQLKNGYAECLKHALITGINEFEKLDFNDAQSIEQIKLSAKIKMQIVEADEFETNQRKALNVGHTIAHAIESHGLENAEVPIEHGHAVAVGIICEAYISLKKNMLTQQEFEAIHTKIKATFEKHIFEEYSIETMLEIMQHDKKNDSQIRFSLLNGIGNVAINETASDDLIRESLLFYLRKY